MCELTIVAAVHLVGVGCTAAGPCPGGRPFFTFVGCGRKFGQWVAVVIAADAHGARAACPWLPLTQLFGSLSIVAAVHFVVVGWTFGKQASKKESKKESQKESKQVIAADAHGARTACPLQPSTQLFGSLGIVAPVGCLLAMHSLLCLQVWAYV
jgi:hypothetical protein